MKQILLGLSKKGVFVTDKFPKAGENSVTGVYLPEFNSVEEVIFTKDRDFLIAEFGSNAKEVIRFADLL